MNMGMGMGMGKWLFHASMTNGKLRMLKDTAPFTSTVESHRGAEGEYVVSAWALHCLPWHSLLRVRVRFRAEFDGDDENDWKEWVK